MPKVILEYNLPEDQEDFETAMQGASAKIALSEIDNQVFRPAQKHGYSDEAIRALLEAIPEGKGEELIGLLEEKFYEILNEYDVNGD